ncbi:hypothetical protein LY78DRAFT_471990 [Colletotrichum sublineola]|nr:hypothetical protein LY78DRAFT_471990 [Colletotrichum sublineola]
METIAPKGLLAVVLYSVTGGPPPPPPLPLRGQSDRMVVTRVNQRSRVVTPMALLTFIVNRDIEHSPTRVSSIPRHAVLYTLIRLSRWRAVDVTSARKNASPSPLHQDQATPSSSSCYVGMVPH